MHKLHACKSVHGRSVELIFKPFFHAFFVRALSIHPLPFPFQRWM